MPSLPEPTIFIVDDEPDIRDALQLLLKSVGLEVETFGSAQAFLDTYDPARPGCLILDVRMPGMCGPELQEKLRANQISIPHYHHYRSWRRAYCGAHNEGGSDRRHRKTVQ